MPAGLRRTMAEKSPGSPPFLKTTETSFISSSGSRDCAKDREAGEKPGWSSGYIGRLPRASERVVVTWSVGLIVKI